MCVGESIPINFSPGLRREGEKGGWRGGREGAERGKKKEREVS